MGRAKAFADLNSNYAGFTARTGKRYNQEKKAGFKGNQYAESGGGNIYHKQKTAEAIADDHNVSEKTVRRAAKDAEFLEACPNDERAQEDSNRLCRAPSQSPIGWRLIPHIT